MEKTIQFYHNENSLFGILHCPDQESSLKVTVLLIIGGPQTRVGSHRLYVQLARYLANHGITVFRFDYEGMGDSEGNFIGFEGALPSIEAAIDYLKTEKSVPKDFLLWTICDGVQPTLLCATHHKNFVKGIILCNPFFSETMLSRSDVLNLFHQKRINSLELFEKIPYHFRKIYKIPQKLKAMFFNSHIDNPNPYKNSFTDVQNVAVSIIEIFNKIENPIRLILSEEDPVSFWYRHVFGNLKGMKNLEKNGRIKHRIIKKADHTFSEPVMKDVLFETTSEFIQEIGQLNQNKSPSYSNQEIS